MSGVRFRNSFRLQRPSKRWTDFWTHSRPRKGNTAAKASFHHLPTQLSECNLWGWKLIIAIVFHLENDGLLKRLHAATRVANDTVLASLYSPRGLRIVGSYAFQDPPQLEHLSALKCLNNVLVRSEGSRRHLVPEVGPEKIVKLIKVRMYKGVAGLTSSSS
jgi:hypothetical protein